ncbi:MAG TPA: 5-dehydro-2-deoxygluconokinase [Acidimicrobiales bacterium]|nr:5-dehydro-2-deoxygluconokinase [Acidimicrobiales bacterium]
MSDAPQFDVLTIGRVGIDFYPTSHGSIVTVKHFDKFLGGSPTNVAIAAARLGERAAVITRTGSDPFGDYVHVALREFGVDDRFVSPVEGLQTPVVFCETHPPDHFPIYFYRSPMAPDLMIRPEELDMSAVSGARLFWATVGGLSAEPSRSATMAALEVRSRRDLTVLDLDYRPTFWSDGAAARAAAKEALAHATVAVGNLDEVEVAVGTRDPDEAADRLLDAGLRLAVVKRGPEGVLGKSREDRVEVPPVPTTVVNGLGAGDAFGGALCHGMLAAWSLERTLGFASAAGAIVASRLACSEAMPYADEVEEVVTRGTT